MSSLGDDLNPGVINSDRGLKEDLGVARELREKIYLVQSETFRWESPKLHKIAWSIGLGFASQWWSSCLAYGRPWVQSPHTNTQIV
jgi:hypothetical protein